MANKKALIAGVTGQDGSYLAELLLEVEQVRRLQGAAAESLPVRASA